MQVGNKRLGRVVAFAAAFVVVAWALLSHYGVWNRFLVWIMFTQGELHRQLAAAMRQVAQEGWVAAGALLNGGITVVSPDGRVCRHLPLPDRYPTNVCFGGPDMRTLYVTLSATGRLIAIDDWPVPGLRLHGAR